VTGPLDGARLSRRSLLHGAIGAAGLAALAGCGASSSSQPAAEPTLEPKADGDITWFSWAEYADPTIISSFEKKYGVKVNMAYFDSNDTMIQKMAAGLPYDVITNNSAYMQPSILGGLLRPFALDALSNHAEILPFFQKPSYDDGPKRYSVPYSGGPTGIVYRTDKMTPTHSWDDLWNNPSASGHIFVLDYVPDTIGASLLRKGYSLNSGDPSQVDAATNALLALKPQLGGISSNTRTDIGNGTAWIHHAWVPDAFNVMTTSKYADKLQWELTTKDGVPSGIDLLTIGIHAKSPGTALLFIDWMLAPENLSKTVKYTGQVSGTRTGDATYAEVMKAYPTLLVPHNYYETALWRQALTGARQTLWTQQWNRFEA
jgi:spermidine/putrescine transport system substrate-binding protein